ncbi:MAG TPA: cyclic nucleotide-binding domain-containing protein, partial [Blastocatellia bacterium]|nr:cyclic nucleotide-binding domain-containing protein [Blastocatellia bacterium]
HVATDYQISSARYLGSQRVLNVLDDLARLESTPWYIADRMRRQYRQKSQDARHEADQIAERCPEFIIDLQERSGRKLLLMAKTESIAHQLESGTLTPEVAKRLRDEIRQEVRALRPYRSGRLKLGPGDLLRRWPPFQNLSADEVAYLAIRLRLQLAEEGQIILNQGQEADAMFFIARGVVRLTRENNGASRDIATLMAGDFFGETALLPGEPYIDAATAVTPCSLYRLERVDLEVAMANDPIVRRALEKLEGERAAGRDNRG